VSFVDRDFPAIVRDVLTNLTQGVSQETHRVVYDPNASPVVVPDIVLQRRPVARVSLVEGFIAGRSVDDEPLPWTFSLNDYTLVANPADPADRSTLRFLPGGRRPAPNSELRINYYPRTTDPTPLTDLNVGSVVRTLSEAISRELALLYAQLNRAYDSGFVDTASGASLDRVTALLGLRRYRAGRPVGSVRFSRRAGAIGAITIPAGTPITDAADKLRYETVETREMLPAESTAEVRVRGASDGTPAVDAGVLVVVQRAIAGIEKVINERPTTLASAEESDVELRARAKGALGAANKGTLDALRNGLLLLPEVRDVKIVDMPNGVPGEIQISVSLADAGDGPLPPAVRRRIDELRPAGIRVLADPAGRLALQVRVALILAGSFQPAAEIDAIRAAVRSRLIDEVQRNGVGRPLRVRPLSAALLADPRLVDVTLTVGAQGQASAAAGSDFVPPGETILDLAEQDIVFDAESYDQPAADGERPVTVEVRARLALTLVAGVALDAARTQLGNRLKAFFGAQTAGGEITFEQVLAALRDDGRYAIDPLRLSVTLAADDQFAQLAQGGPRYTVQPGQSFSVAAVEVTP